MNETTSTKNKWWSSGYKYTNPIAISEDQWKSQLIVAANEYAHASEMIVRHEVAEKLKVGSVEQREIWRNIARIIREDIYKMVTTMEPINEPWPHQPKI